MPRYCQWREKMSQKQFLQVGCKTKWDMWSDPSTPPCASAHQFRLRSSILSLIRNSPLQGIWIYLLAFGFGRVSGNLSNHWVQETMQIQEIQFPGRTISFSLQIRALHILPVGGLQQDKGRDGGADLPNFLLGGSFLASLSYLFGTSSVSWKD